MFDKIERVRATELHFKVDEASQLRAIIAIHSTKLGPALGGCRCIEYASTEDAVDDALRLAKGMSYKAALAKVEQGGGKAVIIKPAPIKDRKALYQAFGNFVNELGGRYITAVDSGTSLNDMDEVASVTSYVSGSHVDGLDPSPMTALGVLSGIKAAVFNRRKHHDLKDLTVAIQGVGAVGWALAKLLHEEGARLVVSDLDETRLQQAREAFGARSIHPDEIYHTPCDIFAPCGLGGIINDHTLAQLQCEIIAGSANNQLAQERHGETLYRNGILYAPDYVISAGGLINVSLGLKKAKIDELRAKIWHIGDTLQDIFTRATADHAPTSRVADQLAEEILGIHPQSTACNKSSEAK